MTIVSHKHKFIFLKSRKTAGTSVSVKFVDICGDEDTIAISADAKHLTSRKTQNIAIQKDNKTHKIGQHTNAQKIKEIFGDTIWNSYFKFSIERNPYDRLISFYYWRKKWYDLDCTFEDFAFSALTNSGKLKKFTKEFSNKPFYIINDAEGICVEKVIRFENLDSDIKEIFEAIGVNEPSTELPRLKADIRVKNEDPADSEKEYRKYYKNEEILKLAKDKFQFYEETFGYTF